MLYNVDIGAYPALDISLQACVAKKITIDLSQCNLRYPPTNAREIYIFPGELG